MRTKLLMIFAFLAISVGLYGVINPPSKEHIAKINHIVDDKPVYYKAYFLTHDVKAGQPISKRDYEVRRLSSNEAAELGILSDTSLVTPAGSVYHTAMKTGSVISQSLILKPEDPGYIDVIITPNHVPYAVKVNPETVVGGLIDSGTKIDVLAITQPSEGYGNTQISIEPILTGIKVLQVKKEQPSNSGSSNNTQIINNHLILELTRKQVAQLTIAKKIAQIEVHKSIGNYSLNDLSSNAGDVLPNFKAIKEFRANKVTVK